MAKAVTCPTCRKRHKDGGGSGGTAESSGLLVYLEGKCPLCLEEKSPMIALPCGHAVCQEDFDKLGGTLRQPAENDNGDDGDDAEEQEQHRGNEDRPPLILSGGSARIRADVETTQTVFVVTDDSAATLWAVRFLFNRDRGDHVDCYAQIGRVYDPPMTERGGVWHADTPARRTALRAKFELGFATTATSATVDDGVPIRKVLVSEEVGALWDEPLPEGSTVAGGTITLPDTEENGEWNNRRNMPTDRLIYEERDGLQPNASVDVKIDLSYERNSGDDDGEKDPSTPVTFTWPAPAEAFRSPSEGRTMLLLTSPIFRGPEGQRCVLQLHPLGYLPSHVDDGFFSLKLKCLDDVRGKITHFTLKAAGHELSFLEKLDIDWGEGAEGELDFERGAKMLDPLLSFVDSARDAVEIVATVHPTPIAQAVHSWKVPLAAINKPDLPPKSFIQSLLFKDSDSIGEDWSIKLFPKGNLYLLNRSVGVMFKPHGGGMSYHRVGIVNQSNGKLHPPSEYIAYPTMLWNHSFCDPSLLTNDSDLVDKEGNVEIRVETATIADARKCNCELCKGFGRRCDTIVGIGRGGLVCSTK